MKSVRDKANDFKKIKKMRSLFVVAANYSNQEGRTVQVYQTLHLSKSLLYRIKSLGIDPKLNAKMIMLNVKETKEKYEQSAKERKAVSRRRHYILIKDAF